MGGGWARQAVLLASAITLLLAALSLKHLLLPLPSPPDSAAAGRFDANRAVARLARALGDQQPHPVDSSANDAVRARLMSEMRAVGLAPRVTDHFACNSLARARAIACARVRNVVATIGPARGRHLLLSAHYDSTFASPGAGDAGIAVATLLEVAAQMRDRPLARPVSFLFNEGEEMGLIGARAFLEADPLAAEIGAVLNFEARGVEGPAIMFETSRPNAPAIARYARALDRPVANSLTTDLYRLIPNSTDVAVFEERDWTILNFAIIGNETRYHSGGDNLAALDRRSLQHMGDQALALALDFATKADPVDAGERIYTDLLGRRLVTMPLAVGLVLLGLLLLFFLVMGCRRQALGRPLAAVVVAMIGATVLAWVGQTMVSLLRSGDWWRGHPIMTELAVYASALAAGLIALVLVAPNADRTRLRPAWWLPFVAGGAAIAAIAPGGTIFFLLPPLVAAAGLAFSKRWPSGERIAAIAASALLFLSFGPALELFEELMSNGPHWMFAPIGAAILMPALIELRPVVARIPRPSLVAGMAGLFLLGWAAPLLAPAYSEDRQQLFTIEYVWNATERRAHWAVNNDGAVVPFAARWTRMELPYSQRRRWVARAPALPVGAPRLEPVQIQPAPGGRHLTLRLRTNGAESVALIAPPEARLRAAGAPGFIRPFGAHGRDNRFVIRCVGRSCDGALLHVFAIGTTPIELTVVGTRSGLPPAAESLVRARPGLARPQYAPDSTISLGRLRL